jgi:ABC-type bacteriocin/lantibiotic exporter with double-glycine peptidase domain
LVAHRPETINAAERVVMLKDGLALEVRAAANSAANSHVAKDEEKALVA